MIEGVRKVSVCVKDSEEMVKAEYEYGFVI